MKTAFPTEGVTRCHCGSKYWDGTTCHSCGSEFDGRDYTDLEPGLSYDEAVRDWGVGP